MVQNLLKGDIAEFKVIEFSKEFKRVVVSHMQTHNDNVPDDSEDESSDDIESDKNDKK